MTKPKEELHKYDKYINRYVDVTYQAEDGIEYTAWALWEGRIWEGQSLEVMFSHNFPKKDLIKMEALDRPFRSALVMSGQPSIVRYIRPDKKSEYMAYVLDRQSFEPDEVWVYYSLQLKNVKSVILSDYQPLNKPYITKGIARQLQHEKEARHE